MFGKKGSSGGKKKSVKQGPSVNFFAAHSEKLALGLVVAVLGYMVYEGIGGKSYDKTRQPEQLSSDAEKLLQTIRNGDPWPQLVAERTIPTGIEARTKDARLPTNPEDYPSSPLSPGSGTNAYALRGDPALRAPVKVLGQSVVGLIAVEAADSYVDPFEDFEDAGRLKGSKRSSGRNNRNMAAGAEGGAAGMNMGMEGAGMPGGGMPGMTGGTGFEQKRIFPAEYNKGYSIMGGAMGGMGGMSGEGGMAGGMPGMPGAGGMPGGTAPTVPGTGTTTGTTLSGGLAVKQKKIKAEPIFFNAVTALVEHEEMVKEFDAKLRESASYYPMRDRPYYLSFEVERAEVRGNQPLKWTECTNASKQLAMMKTWMPKPQTIPEVIDPISYDQALTMPIPPVLIYDYRRFAKHPDIDWIWDAGMAAINIMRENEARTSEALKAAEEAQESMFPGERPSAMGGMPGMGGGMGGMSGEMGAGMPGGGMMGGGMPGGGMMGAEGGMMGGGMPGGGMMGGGMPGGGMMGMPGDGGMSMGMPGMGGEGGGYGMGMGMTGMQIPKYKMVRFYDRLTPADIGKTFKYRVRLVMEDPNYPSDYYMAPKASDLDRDVWTRVSKLRQEEDPKAEAVAKQNRERKPNKQGILPPAKIFHRTKLRTPWSDESNGVYVRGTDDVFFGKMPKKAGEPTAEAVLVRLDVQKGAYVPLFSFATEDKPAARIPIYKRGAVLVMEKLTTHFAHPITMVMKEWVDYKFNNGWNTVVDIRGNDPLALSNAKDDPLSDDGEMMVLMSDGRVEVTNEFDDAFWYRAFTLADERERAENPNAGMYGMGGEGGMPGAGGGKMGMP